MSQLRAVFIHQNLLYKDGPHAERVKIRGLKALKPYVEWCNLTCQNNKLLLIAILQNMLTFQFVFNVNVLFVVDRSTS